MNPEDVKEFTNKRPFEPFKIRLDDGRSFGVEHPDAIAVGRRMVVVMAPADYGADFIHCALRHIVSIDLAEPAA